MYLISIYLPIHLETWYPVGVHPGVVRHQREAAKRGDRQVKTEPGRTLYSHIALRTLSISCINI